eukprot:gene14022-4995_t
MAEPAGTHAPIQQSGLPIADLVGRTLQAVKRLCHGQPMCKLYAINRVYGDPCVGTYKYLQVTYHCRRRYTSKRSIVCEGRTARMGCPLGLTLRIQAARYGRTNRIHCRHSAMGNTRCIAHRYFTA